MSCFHKELYSLTTNKTAIPEMNPKLMLVARAAIIVGLTLIGAPTFAQPPASGTRLGGTAATEDRSISGDVSLVKDVFPIIWHIERFNARSSLNAQLVLPSKREGDPPEALSLEAPEGENYQYPNDLSLTRMGDGMCNDTDFDISELKTKGRVRIRTRIVEGLPALEEVFVAALKQSNHPGEPSRVFFKLASSKALDTTCANF